MDINWEEELRKIASTPEGIKGGLHLNLIELILIWMKKNDVSQVELAQKLDISEERLEDLLSGDLDFDLDLDEYIEVFSSIGINPEVINLKKKHQIVQVKCQIDWNQELEELKKDPEFRREGLELDFVHSLLEYMVDRDVSLDETAGIMGISRKELKAILEGDKIVGLMEIPKYLAKLNAEVILQYYPEDKDLIPINLSTIEKLKSKGIIKQKSIPDISACIEDIINQYLEQK